MRTPSLRHALTCLIFNALLLATTFFLKNYDPRLWALPAALALFWAAFAAMSSPGKKLVFGWWFYALGSVALAGGLWCMLSFQPEETAPVFHRRSPAVGWWLAISLPLAGWLGRWFSLVRWQAVLSGACAIGAGVWVLLRLFPVLPLGVGHFGVLVLLGFCGLAFWLVFSETRTLCTRLADKIKAPDTLPEELLTCLLLPDSGVPPGIRKRLAAKIGLQHFLKKYFARPDMADLQAVFAQKITEEAFHFEALTVPGKIFDTNPPAKSPGNRAAVRPPSPTEKACLAQIKDQNLLAELARHPAPPLDIRLGALERLSDCGLFGPALGAFDPAAPGLVPVLEKTPRPCLKTLAADRSFSKEMHLLLTILAHGPGEEVTNPEPLNDLLNDCLLQAIR